MDPSNCYNSYIPNILPKRYKRILENLRSGILICKEHAPIVFLKSNRHSMRIAQTEFAALCLPYPLQDVLRALVWTCGILVFLPLSYDACYSISIGFACHNRVLGLAARIEIDKLSYLSKEVIVVISSFPFTLLYCVGKLTHSRTFYLNVNEQQY